MDNREKIKENLKDAGCEKKEIEKILSCYLEGNTRRMEQLIDQCRMKQLKKLHESQQCIDRLDYLCYELKNAGD